MFKLFLRYNISSWKKNIARFSFPAIVAYIVLLQQQFLAKTIVAAIGFTFAIILNVLFPCILPKVLFLIPTDSKTKVDFIKTGLLFHIVCYTILGIIIALINILISKHIAPVIILLDFIIFMLLCICLLSYQNISIFEYATSGYDRREAQKLRKYFISTSCICLYIFNALVGTVSIYSYTILSKSICAVILLLTNAYIIKINYKNFFLMGTNYELLYK